MKGTLQFNKLKFYGYHGTHAEEANVGCFFYIDIKAVLITDFTMAQPSLTNTINYETLYPLLLSAFNHKEDLIETVAINIYNAIKKEFRNIDQLIISIRKENPLGNGNFNPCFILDDKE